MRGLLALVPLLFTVVCVGGILLTVGSLLSLAHPDLGFFRSNSHDALSLYYGHGIYGDPATAEYTGLLYTPGLPLLVALLDHLKLWDGWAALIGIVGVLWTTALIGAVAYVRPEGETTDRVARGLALATAAGFAGLGLWLISPLEGDLLFQAGPDHLAWALALTGAVLAARGATASVRTAVLVVVLLTAGIWVKQSTVVLAFCVAVWLLWRARKGREAWRPVLLLTGGLLVLNLIVLAVANVLTDGWQWYFNVSLAQHEKSDLYGPRTWAKDVLYGFWPAGLLLVALWLGVLRRLPWRDGGLPALLTLFVLIGTPAAFIFRSKQGGSDNQYIGVLWAVGLACAIAWREAQGVAAQRKSLLASGAAAVMVIIAIGGTAKDSLRVSLHGFRTHFYDSTAQLRAYAADKSVYHPIHSDISRDHDRRVYQDIANLGDLLASGERPQKLIDRFLDRRFDAVMPFQSALGDGRLRAFDDYSAAYGKAEAGFISKLDTVIAARYMPAPAGAPRGMLVPRPGPEPATWMRSCFGPFPVGKASFEIRAGGGFWCQTRAGDPELRLRQTPAPVSEIVTEGAVAPKGELLIGGLGGRTNGFKVRIARVVQVQALLQNGTWTANVVDGKFRNITLPIEVVKGTLRLKLGGTTSGAPKLIGGPGAYEVAVSNGAKAGALSLAGPQGVVFNVGGLGL